MTINIFKEIFLIPPKCGSRFFEEHFGERKTVDLFKLKDSEFIDKIQYVVLRDPFEYLKSAVHTEFINFFNGSHNKSNITEVGLLDYILKIDSQSHWHRHNFRELYLFILKFKKPPTIIMLDDLNHFIENVLNEKYSSGFNKTKYDFSEFPIYISKDDLWDIYIKNNYPEEFGMFYKLLQGDIFFWNKLIQLCPKYNTTNPPKRLI
jgi:hypothetical protein